MSGPNNWLFLITLAVAFAGLLVWLARARHLAVKLLAGTLAFAISTLFGAGLVNNFYQYYTSWGAIYDALTNTGAVDYPPAALASAEHRHVAGVTRAVRAPPGKSAAVGGEGTTAFVIPRLALRATADPARGRLVQLQLPGAASGLNRSGFVYLPPQYFEPAYANARFPVLELLHGQPGDPGNWIYALRLPTVMHDEINAGRVGPMVVVMPATYSGAHGTDCVDSKAARNDTYLSRDVPADIAANFRVLPPGMNWGIGGLSDGGYCAANLALRHRGSFGAVASMDGFYTASADLGVLRHVLNGNISALIANDPTAALARTAPLPRFWIMAGASNRTDLTLAQDFRAAVQTREPIRYVVLFGGQHTPSAWRAVLPDLLTWAWTTLSGEPSPTGVEHFRLSGEFALPATTSLPPLS